MRYFMVYTKSSKSVYIFTLNNMSQFRLAIFQMHNNSLGANGFHIAAPWKSVFF